MQALILNGAVIISLRRHYLQTCPTSSTYRSSHFLPLALQGPTGLSALDSHLPPPQKKIPIFSFLFFAKMKKKFSLIFLIFFILYLDVGTPQPEDNLSNTH